MILLNPRDLKDRYPDARSAEVMRQTVSFFEHKGKARLLEDYYDRVWYADFLSFIAENRIFATMCTPAGEGAEDGRWDTWRNCEFAEILGFYGLQYWYTWQVSVLGLGPIWMSTERRAVRQRAAKALEEGGIFAFGLSEKDARRRHLLHRHDPHADGGTATRHAAASTTSATATRRRSSRPSASFATPTSTCSSRVDSQHENYNLVKNVVASQNYVSEYALAGLSRSPKPTFIAKGDHAWNSALNTVNIGKYNLGWASIGMCTHCALRGDHHASNRRLYNMHVTDFPHVKQMFTDALRATGRHEAVCASGRRLHASPLHPRTAAICCTTRW